MGNFPIGGKRYYKTRSLLKKKERKYKSFKEHNVRWNCPTSQRKQKYHDKRRSGTLQDTGCIPDNYAREKRKRAKHSRGTIARLKRARRRGTGTKSRGNILPSTEYRSALFDVAEDYSRMATAFSCKCIVDVARLTAYSAMRGSSRNAIIRTGRSVGRTERNIIPL